MQKDVVRLIWDIRGVVDKAINNQSVRERFGLDKNKSVEASRIISDTLEQGLIKFANADVTSKKFATYKPYYA